MMSSFSGELSKQREETDLKSLIRVNLGCGSAADEVDDFLCSLPCFMNKTSPEASSEDRLLTGVAWLETFPIGLVVMVIEGPWAFALLTLAVGS